MNTKAQRMLREDVTGYLFILPAAFLLAAFVIYPLFAALYNSFTSWNLIFPRKFIGLRNYTELFQAEEFWQSIANTFLYALIIIPFSLVIGFAVAFLIRKPSKANVVYRTIYITPMVTSMVAMSAVWLFLYNPQYGLVNTILEAVGLEGKRWLNEPDTALPALSVIIIWKNIGYVAVLYLGGLQNISKSVTEAAELDGATGMRRLWHIDLPLVSPTSFMLLILLTIDTLKLFTTIDVMTQGGPAGSTENLVEMLYKYGFQNSRIGYASAISVILFLLIVAVNLVQMKLERKVNYD